jgi:hypothetical protein
MARKQDARVGGCRLFARASACLALAIVVAMCGCGGGSSNASSGGNTAGGGGGSTQPPQTFTREGPSFNTVGGAPTEAFYDETRKLLYVSNPNLNEVEVLSGADLSIITRVNVPQPMGIDQMSDGKTLVVGSWTQGIFTIDQGTLAVTRL